MMQGNEAARTALQSALVTADTTIGEGRDRIQDLRWAAPHEQDLAAAFATLGQHLADEGTVAFEVTQRGTERLLEAAVVDELLRIGSEAIVNAFRHARASRVSVELAYLRRRLEVAVRDDGLGISPAVISADGVPGHWGVRGMRERAMRIGAQLHITRPAEGGTQALVCVPARRAYRKRDGRFPWRALVPWIRRTDSQESVAEG